MSSTFIAKETGHNASRWSFYNLLDDYKSKDAMIAPVAAPPPMSTSTADSLESLRRIQSDPPRSRVEPEHVPLPRSRSSSTLHRRVRFADDGLIQMHLIEQSQPEQKSEGGNADAIGGEEGVGEGSDVLPERSHPPHPTLDSPINTLSQWISRQREIQRFAARPDTTPQGLGLDLDLPHFPSGSASTASASSTMRSLSSWASMQPLTPCLSRSPFTDQYVSDAGHTGIDGPSTPLPLYEAAPPAFLPGSDADKGEHEAVADKDTTALEESPDPYGIRKTRNGRDHRWSIDRYPFEQLDFAHLPDTMQYSYWSPDVSDDEGDDEDEISDEEVGCVIEAKAARVSIATVVSSISSGASASGHSSASASPPSIHGILLTSPTSSVRRRNATRLRYRTGTVSIPRGQSVPEHLSSLTEHDSSPRASRPSEHRSTTEYEARVFAIMEQETAIMQGTAICAARRRRRAMSAPGEA